MLTFSRATQLGWGNQILEVRIFVYQCFLGLRIRATWSSKYFPVSSIPAQVNEKPIRIQDLNGCTTTNRGW